MLDTFRLCCDEPLFSPIKLADVKTRINKQETLEGIINELGSTDEALKIMGRVIEDRCLEELLSLAVVEGPSPLSEWPNDIKSNWFSDVVKFAQIHSPITLSFILRLTVKELEANVKPVHVINIATVYAQLAQLVDNSNSVLSKINTLQLKLDGLTDEGLNAQAKLNLAQTARNLRYKRDEFAEVAEKLLLEETKRFPDQKTLDNCDQKGEHTTVEYRQTETQDTSHLPNESKSPEEIEALFQPSLVMINHPDMDLERAHLSYVIAVSVGREIGFHRQDAENLVKYLPKHHQHKWSHLPLEEAQIKLVPPHYFQETVIAEMIQMAEELQKELLELLKNQIPNNLQFSNDLDHIYRVVPAEESPEAKSARLLAEYRVKAILLDHGENIGHGDLLTFQKFRQAKLMRISSVRAVDRLEFLGIFRMELFHLVMSKTAQDIKAGMPDRNMVCDKGSLANAAAKLGINGWFSNEKKRVVKCGNYERHHQHLKAWQLSLLLNMYDNYIKEKPAELAAVKSSKAAERFILGMLRHYGALWYWDPDFVDPYADHKCDLFLSSRDQVIRLALDLAFHQCEKENDAQGLRTLRRVMIPYFLNKSKAQTSKYARYTLMDLVVELSSSERSQVRMEHLVTVNPSGTKGGGLFRDKYNEVMVRLVKDAIRRQHSALGDLQIQTVIQSLSAMTALHDHNLKSRLYETTSRHKSGDLVGKQRFELLSELVSEVDPFSTSRETVTDFDNKSSGSPFASLKTSDVIRFFSSVKMDFMLHYPELSFRPHQPEKM